MKPFLSAGATVGMDRRDILKEIEEDLEDLSVPEDGPYSSSFERDEEPAADVPRNPTSAEWPDVSPIERNLTPEEWGIFGEGLDSDREEFAAMLNEGMIGSQPAEIRPDAPEGWGEAFVGSARSAQNPRGYHLFTHVGVTPATMFRVQGQIGANELGGTAEEFALSLEPVLEDYVELYEQGERPGKFYAFLDNDGVLQGPQEGRHRAAAAMLAGIDWVPVVLLWDTSGTFDRPKSYREGTPGYRAEYPDDV